MSLLGKQSGPKLFVRLSKVSALEHVRFSQVLLYKLYLHSNPLSDHNELLSCPLCHRTSFKLIIVVNIVSNSFAG